MTAGPAGARLFVSDIDGTLVTPDKQLTPAALAAVAALKAAGIPFSVVSSRPARGMAKVVQALDLTLPYAAFNGGNVVDPVGGLVVAHRLVAEAAALALRLMEQAGVLPWVFADDAWLLSDLNGPNVERERRTVGFDPTVVASFEPVIDRIDKIVAPSNDPGLLDRVEAELRAALGRGANVERSQAYYIDITHPLANKGEAVRTIAAHIGADLAQTIVIGDMTNDIAMFRVAGFAIAMGQAPEAVKAEAGAVTANNTDDGFAKAVTSLVLPRLALAAGKEANA
jgi:Cof subfamily protein (haloacid dehalogenase superfamily)